MAQTKKARLETQRRYRNSEKGQATIKRYNESEDGQTVIRLHNKSNERKASWERYRNKNRIKRNAYNSVYRKSLKGKAVLKAALKRWKQSKRGKAITSKNYHKRKAIKASLPHTLTAKRWREICEEYNYRCAYCMEQVELTQDHIVPITKGGAYTEDNIVPACGPCNSSKGNKTLIVWLASQHVQA